ncbi:MAG: D-cysteine desulfhydrase family protein [Pseudomonadota bacterium]
MTTRHEPPSAQAKARAFSPADETEDAWKARQGQLFERLARFDRVKLGHTPTPLDAMANLAAHWASPPLFVKRDDCTGLAFGGNKVRQLEFYLGAAKAAHADTVLITGAVQSNFTRLAAAAARTLGMDCHMLLEERVGDLNADASAAYRHSGNVLLDRMLGATIHTHLIADDEDGADARLHEIAAELSASGAKPYVIPLGPGHPPLGALGYVAGGLELAVDLRQTGVERAEIVVASGSGHTHAGLLFAIRALGLPWRVEGICVRRAASLQRDRITQRCAHIADLLGVENPVNADDVNVADTHLAPGYGKAGKATLEAIALGARTEALMLDPVYTGKAFAGFIDRVRNAASGGPAPDALVFVHTGGLPGLFAYESQLRDL